MCGIAGVVSFEGGPVEESRLRRMAGALAHRGPDAEGVWIDAERRRPWGSCTAGCRSSTSRTRPTSRSANEDGRVLVMLNGEIYNFAELRARARGAPPLPLARRHRDDRPRLRGRGRRASWRGWTACSRWRSGTRGGGACCWRATASARSRSTTGRDARAAACSRPRSRPCWRRGVPAALDAAAPARVPGVRLRAHAAHALRGHRRGCRRPPPWWWTRGGVHGRRARTGTSRFPAPGEARRVPLAEAADERARAARRGGAQAARRRRAAGRAALRRRRLRRGGWRWPRARSARLSTRSRVGFEGDAFFDERPPARALAAHIGAEHHEAVVRPAGRRAAGDAAAPPRRAVRRLVRAAHLPGRARGAPARDGRPQRRRRRRGLRRLRAASARR